MKRQKLGSKDKNSLWVFFLFSSGLALLILVFIREFYLELDPLHYLEFLGILCFLLLSQYSTAFLLEKFSMDFEKRTSQQWVSAPIGVLFSLLLYSILALSIDLLI